MLHRGTNPSSVVAFALASGFVLSACGARTSLPGPACGWSVRDGVAGVLRLARGHFAVLDDGSVVLPMSDVVSNADGGATGVPWLRKLDPNGEIAWDVSVGPAAYGVLRVARDAADRLFVVGDVVSGVHSVLGAELTCPAERACTFVGTLAGTGTLEWSKVFSSELGSGWPLELAVTADGRMIVLGDFEGTIDFGCGPLIAGQGVDDVGRYLAQLSPSGECLWSRALPTTHRENAFVDIAVDDEGEVAVALPLDPRHGAQTIDLGGGPVPFDTDEGPGFAVAKYAPNGDLVFGKLAIGDLGLPGQGGGASFGAKVALTVAGDVLLSAGLAGPIDLGGGPRGEPSRVRYFVTLLDATGDELWTRDLVETPSPWENEPPYEITASGVPFAIAAAPRAGFFLAGEGRPGMTILGKPTPKTTLLVAAYDAGGEPNDVQTFSLAGSANVAGLEASAGGALVLAGFFMGEIDFGHGPLVSEGVADAVVAKICR